MDLGLKGRKALVLGASRGLGRAIASALAAEGATIYAAARNAQSADLADGVIPVTLDLSDRNSVDALTKRLISEGGVDILVNNSGGPKPGPAAGQDMSAWASAFEQMALSIFAITDALLPAMIARGWGRIITIGSSGVVQPIPNLALSNGVRGAISGWSKTLAAEVAAHGVTVNMILPGRIETDRLRELDANKATKTGMSAEAVRKASHGDIPAGRYGTPEEFAAVATFLASKQASYVTGTQIRVDGGLVRGF
ncbi:SDR family oxidoreductase [Rhizobium sp. NRK18]|uniref:SDR family oxidoreductase n=1 Tax=Rhizobium sp. NRK18 TaxID=2964667 RepID=UPI0021C2AD48|nr:SDR family oxidoreductase [Rhizobium sp. NRK18]MCQ2002558.1 SDR family oxidoreductase [Rhizobium sp. NRK18]